MKGDIAKLMQQAQKMQSEVKKAQSEISDMLVEGQSGGGLVKATINGEHIVQRVEIDDDVWEENDKAMLEDLVAAAFNSAVQTLKLKTKAKLQSLTHAFDMPTDFELPEKITTE